MMTPLGCKAWHITSPNAEVFGKKIYYYSMKKKKVFLSSKPSQILAFMLVTNSVPDKAFIFEYLRN